MYACLADSSPHIDVGYSKALTKREFAEAIADAVGFNSAIKWYRSKPDATPRKLMDSSRIRGLGCLSWIEEIRS